MSYLSLKNLPLKNKKVLVRVDFNVPFNEKGEISDLTRIKESIPTINYIIQQGGCVILLSHLGRPKGIKEEKYTLKPCALALSSLMQHPVLFVNDCLGEKTQKQINSMQPGDILLLENLRFYPGEENPTIDPSFAKTLASYGDLYINDAFGASHRKHASTFTLPTFFPKKAAAGFLMTKELLALNKVITHPKPPFHVLIGGSKVSSKIGVLKALTHSMQALYIGGGMAFTFLAALKHEIGDSLYEPDQIEAAKKILDACKKQNIPLFLPSDFIVSNGITFKTIHISEGIEKGWKGMDIGPNTISCWEKELIKANSIFWNGPLGVFENPNFAKGTFQIAKFLASLSSERIIGGGDSIAAIERLHLQHQFTHLSTGGGACLEFLEKGTLPCIEILSA
ncbi:MAG: phosphoglycerate kinase [Verrucomicrobia bacterium]|nr:phosphoglycerate kinase [Verrucomicrobiota bacterium]